MTAGGTPIETHTHYFPIHLDRPNCLYISQRPIMSPLCMLSLVCSQSHLILVGHRALEFSLPLIHPPLFEDITSHTPFRLLGLAPPECTGIGGFIIQPCIGTQSDSNESGSRLSGRNGSCKPQNTMPRCRSSRCRSRFRPDPVVHGLVCLGGVLW